MPSLRRRTPPLCRRLPRPSDLPAAAALPSLPSKQSSPAGVQRISKSPAAAGVAGTELELSLGHSRQQPHRAPMPCKPVPRPFGSHPPEAPPQERCSALRSFPALAGQGRRRRGVEGGDSSLPHGCIHTSLHPGQAGEVPPSGLVLPASLSASRISFNSARARRGRASIDQVRHCLPELSSG